MAGIEYYFNNLDFMAFQRLINAILVARFGEHARLTPLQGSDGGRDGETAPYNIVRYVLRHPSPDIVRSHFSYHEYDMIVR